MSILSKMANYLTITTFFIINYWIQTAALGKLVYPFTDEGVYLYAVKLISEGLIPYKDFFLAHSPFLLYLISPILALLNFNLEIFRHFYVFWVSLTLIPIYLITYFYTKSRIAGIISLILFMAYPELVQWDSHFFAMRQASLPFLGFALYFLIVRFKPFLAGISLTFFSLSLPSNIILSLCLLVAILIGDVVYQKNSIKEVLFKYQTFFFVYILMTFVGYLLVLLIPNSYQNLILYQFNRPSIDLNTRLLWIQQTLIYNGPIFFWGILGSLIINSKIRLLGLFNILGLIITICLGPFFAPHYLIVLAVGFSISAGIFCAYLMKSKYLKILVPVLIIASIYYSSFSYLKLYLIDNSSPDFFKVVEALKTQPSPLFTFEPIYGLESGLNLTYHYHVSDMRYFRVLGSNLSNDAYIDIINRSNTILIEPFARAFIPSDIMNYIHEYFSLVYDDQYHQIFTRKP